jgi:hypothetical protein
MSALFGKAAKLTLVSAFADRARYVRPYINDREPTPDDTASDYAEPINSFYQQAVLDRADWTVSPQGAIHNGVTFNFVGPVGKIYGVVVLDADMEFLLAEQFDTPVDYSQYGGQLLIVPSFKPIF